MNRPSWQIYGWWGIVLPAFVIIWVTNALILAGMNVFDAKLLAELNVERGPLKFGDTIQLLVSGALAPVGGWLADRYGVRPVMTVGVLLLVGALGPWVTGALFDVTQSYQLGFSVIVVLIAASLVAILFVRLPARAAH